MAQNSIVRMWVPIVCIALAGPAVYNVYGDNTEVSNQAETVACGKQGCAVRKLEEHRNALAQRFVFQTSVSPLKTQEVKCTRVLVLFGEYTCGQ